MIVTRDACAALTLCEFRATGVDFSVHAGVAPFARTTVGILLAHAGAFRSVDCTALAFLARAVGVARAPHRHRVGRVAAARENAVAAFALVPTADHLARLVVVLQWLAAVLRQVEAGVAPFAVAALEVLLALRFVRRHRDRSGAAVGVAQVPGALPHLEIRLGRVVQRRCGRRIDRAQVGHHVAHEADVAQAVLNEIGADPGRRLGAFLRAAARTASVGLVALPLEARAHHAGVAVEIGPHGHRDLALETVGDEVPVRARAARALGLRQQNAIVAVRRFGLDGLRAGAQADHAAELFDHVDLVLRCHELLLLFGVLRHQERLEARVRHVHREALVLLQQVAMHLLGGLGAHVRDIDRHVPLHHGVDQLEAVGLEADLVELVGLTVSRARLVVEAGLQAGHHLDEVRVEIDRVLDGLQDLEHGAPGGCAGEARVDLMGGL